jgi:hypothetical protein
VIYIGLGAFSGTKWLENQTEEVVVVKHNLVAYKGSTKEVNSMKCVKLKGWII